MPWYRVEAWCGPGHQSHSVHYHFSLRRLKESQKKEIWDSEFEGRDAACGKVVRIRALPAQEHRSMARSYLDSIEHAKGMLEILKNTPSLTVYRGYRIRYTDGQGPHADGWSAKLAPEGLTVFTRKGHFALPQGFWFFSEHGAEDAIDLWIKVRRNERRFREEWARRRKAIHDARRIVNAR